jgi:hypothetical protein
MSSSLLVQDRGNGLERGLGVPVSYLRLNMRGVRQLYKPPFLFFEIRLSNTTLFALVGAVGALRQHRVRQTGFRMSQAVS